MSRDKGILSYSPGNCTIKFHTTGLSEPITQNDVDVAQIKTLDYHTNLTIPVLESRVAELDSTAREAVSKKDSAKARNALRRKKVVSEALEKRRANQASLEEILHSIDQAHDSAAMVKAMEQCTGVLKSLNKVVGGVEGVDRVTDKMREEMEKGDEISSIVNELSAENRAVDEAEVDEEFESLERQAREAHEAKERAAREAQEAREKAAREAKEKAEAEETRTRLAELEGLEKKRKEAEEAREVEERRLAAEQKKKDDEAEKELRKSIERLKALHLDKTEGEGEKPVAQDQPAPVPAE
jgi:charged multivesicular body protein 7